MFTRAPWVGFQKISYKNRHYGLSLIYQYLTFCLVCTYKVWKVCFYIRMVIPIFWTLDNPKSSNWNYLLLISVENTIFRLNLGFVCYATKLTNFQFWRPFIRPWKGNFNQNKTKSDSKLSDNYIFSFLFFVVVLDSVTLFTKLCNKK